MDSPSVNLFSAETGKGLIKETAWYLPQYTPEGSFCHSKTFVTVN